MTSEAHESDFQPPPAPSIGIHSGELAEFTRRLESQLASIDSKLNNLLQDTRHRKLCPVAGRETASSKGWLAVSASGGCSPRWSEGSDITHHKTLSDRNLCTFNTHDAEHLPVVHEENEGIDIPSPPIFTSEVRENVVHPSEKSTNTKASTPSDVSDSSVPALSERVRSFLSTNKRHRWKHKLWLFLEDPDISTFGYIYERLVRLVIVTSMITTLLQTLPNPPMSDAVSAVVESTFEVYFLLEVSVRFIASPNYKAFWLDIYNWIDLVSGAFILLRASLGFVIPTPKDCHFRCSLLVGFCPVIRILKMLRRMRQFQLLYTAFVQTYQALQPLMSIFFILLLVFTGTVWVVEPRSNLADFPAAAWFIFVSMTTVGYGDVTPDTAGGSVIVAISVVCGFLYMGIPVGIIGNAFNDVWRDRDRLLVLSRARDRVKSAGYKASELPDLFQMFDHDKNGQLDPAEFCWMIQGLNLGLTQERRRELFKVFDTDDSGGVSAKEFVKALFPESVEDIFVTDAENHATGSTNTFFSVSSDINQGIPMKVVESIKKKKASLS